MAGKSTKNYITALIVIAVVITGAILYINKKGIDSVRSLFSAVKENNQKAFRKVLFDKVYDLEKEEGLFNYHTVVSGHPYSGIMSCRFDTTVEFGVTFAKSVLEVNGFDHNTSIEFEFMVYADAPLGEVLAVLQVDDDTGNTQVWNGRSVEVEAGKWKKVTFVFEPDSSLQIRNGLVKLYVWNKSRDSFYIDDIGVRFVTTEVTGAEGFIKLTANGFKIGEQPFFPLAVNYIISLHYDDNRLWISPYGGYYPGWKFRSLKPDDQLYDLDLHFKMIRELGFNTVRVVGAGETMPDLSHADGLKINVWKGTDQHATYYIRDSISESKYLVALSEMMNIAEKNDLKVIFLTRVVDGRESTEKLLASIARRFKNYRSLFAYDLFNEPLYFDSLDRSKTDVQVFTRRWDRIVKENAPDHLTTIGMTGIREVFEWDPNMVEVDFLSFHPYEYEKEQVRNEMCWYQKYVKKPWIIGETSIPADGDSVNYQDQVEFASITLEQSIACGALGYSWWQFMDVPWYEFHPRYMGLISENGFVPVGKDSIHGTLKPVAGYFQNFNIDKVTKTECHCLENYYNYSGHGEFLMNGKIVDGKNMPVEGAVILGWNQDWSKSFHTVSKADGSFSLGSNFPVYHYRVSATKHEVKSFFIDPKLMHTSRIEPRRNVGKIEIRSLF
jgi:hypothetical protein